MDSIKINYGSEHYQEFSKLGFADFRKRIVEILSETCGSEFEVKEVQVTKNNSVELHGVIISEKDQNVSPTIYLENFYSDYKWGQKNVQEVATDILRVYSTHRIPEEFNIENFTDFESMKGRIIFRLVNKTRNKKLLSELPHRDFLDLAVIYVVTVFEGKNHGTIKVRNEHMKLWDVSEEDLYDAAMKNMSELSSPYIREIGSVIEQLTGNADVGNMEDRDAMYVLTNKSGNYGASGILIKDVLRDFSKKCGTDLYLLPSSVHEFILLPALEGISASVLRKLVMDVNRTVIEAEDFLSDEVYYYSCENDEISVI